MEYISIALELKIFQKKLKNNLTNIYRTQTHDLIIIGYFCIVFVDFMLKGKRLLDYTNLFSSSDYAKNDEIILKCFQ